MEFSDIIFPNDTIGGLSMSQEKTVNVIFMRYKCLHKWTELK